MGRLPPVNRIPGKRAPRRSAPACDSERIVARAGDGAGPTAMPLPGAVSFPSAETNIPAVGVGRAGWAPVPSRVRLRAGQGAGPGAHWGGAANGLGPPRVRASGRGRGAQWRTRSAGEPAGGGRAGHRGSTGRDSRCVRCPPSRRDASRGVGQPDEDRGCGRRRPGRLGPVAGPVTASPIATARRFAAGA
jgi:hypothetical protein